MTEASQERGKRPSSKHDGAAWFNFKKRRLDKVNNFDLELPLVCIHFKRGIFLGNICDVAHFDTANPAKERSTSDGDSLQPYGKKNVKCGG